MGGVDSCYNIPMIDAVIFDCFGVLFGSSVEILTAQCPPENRNELADIFAQSDYGYITHDEFITEASRLLGYSTDHFRRVLSQAHVRNDTLFAVIRRLRQRYPMLKIGLLSNVGGDTINKLFTNEDLALFDARVLSYEEHIAKPNPEAFSLVAERLGIPVGRCIMIDDRAENCDGAEVAGMSAILYTTVANLKRDLQPYGVNVE